MRAHWTISLLFFSIGLLVVCGALALFLAAATERNQASNLVQRVQQLRQLREQYDVAAVLAESCAESSRLVLAEQMVVRAPLVLRSSLIELCDSLQVEILADAPWQISGDRNAPERVVYERTVELRGEFSALLDVLHSLERWPDQLRARELSLTVGSDGELHATWTLQVVRLQLTGGGS